MIALIQRTVATFRSLYFKDAMDGPLRAALEGEPVRWNRLTGTRVDTGWWFIRPAIRLVLTPERLILYAPGKRPLLECRPAAELRERSYNHFTGEWLLAPAPGLPSRRLRLPPAEVRRIVRSIHSTPISL